MLKFALKNMGIKKVQIILIVLSIITTLPIPNLVRFVIEKFKLDFTDKSYIEPYKVPESPDQDELLW